ncbi:GGDEF domain-containing protein [Neptuniibacter sp.]|uniref:GGDEF domain-containing protein n=1 Tax=Neptuniibacter sp. TaxID=1962643 RepID=UPI00261E6C19|nr:GGDEF domain-containing protein [Neptuniibacter sp.]MCP4595061.1 GGDEF domain-containing protein [Neptuniibacter sp.]
MQDARAHIYFVGFALIFLVFAGSSFYSYNRFAESRIHLDQITRNNDAQLSNVLTMRVAVRERAILLWQMTLKEDFFARDELFEQFYHYGSEYQKARASFLQLNTTANESKLFSSLDQETSNRAPVLRHFADLLMSDDPSDHTEHLDQVLTDQTVVADILDQLISLQQQQNNQARENSIRETENILTDLIQFMILVLIFGALFAGFVILSTVKQSRLLEKVNSVLEKQACHDSLTGLPNRAFLLQQLNLLLANTQRHNKLGAVMFIDLDDFKPINDEHGHQVGDQYLQLISVKMKESLRDTDILARLGGDEFILLLSDLASASQVLTVADKLLSTLSAEYQIGEAKVHASASIGIYQLTQDKVSAEQAIILADKAMYQAKKAGKNQYFII